MEIHIIGWTYVCDSADNLMDLLADYTGNTSSGGVDSITNMYVVPTFLLPDIAILDITYNGHTYHLYTGLNGPVHLSKNISKPSSLNGYSPKNNKLLTYPYCYLLLSNNSGNGNILQYEKFKSTTCEFQISGVATCGCSIKCVPYKYTENLGYNEEEGIMCGKFPTLNWSKDNYMTWLSRNALNLSGQIFGVGTLSVSKINFANPSIDNVLNRFSPILESLGQIYNHQMEAPSSRGNVNGGDLNMGQGYNTFFFYMKSIKSEYAKIIDNFFSMYGYKVNDVKIPNITGRLNWNYVKLINPNIEGTEIPEFELNEFKTQMENGITFWHNPLTFRDYSQSNNIVT